MSKPKIRYMGNGVWLCRSKDGIKSIHGFGSTPRFAYAKWWWFKNTWAQS